VIGTVLGGKYRIEKLLGQGGMGSVYLAVNTAIGKRVALKVLLHAQGKVMPAAMERFRREAFTAAAIESDHVASVLDAGEDASSGVAYLVMELLQGEDLGHVLERTGALPAQTVARIVAQVAAGLRDAHGAGIVHRDLKPSNIFLVRRPDGAVVVKLVDFGIARSLSEQETPASKQVTKAGIALGTPPYMSPEQLAASPTLDFRTDLWSLGVVMFQMLCGTNPFEGWDHPQTLARICFMPPPLLHDYAAWCAPEDVAIVRGAMKQDPAERYANAVVLLEAVKRRIEGPAGLTEAMLVGLSAEERARVPAPQAVAMPASMGAPEPIGATSPMPGSHGKPLKSPATPERATAYSPATIPLMDAKGSADLPEVWARTRRRRRVLRGLVVVVVTAALSAVVLQIVPKPKRSPPPDPALPSTTTTLESSTTTTAPLPAPLQSATASGSSTAAISTTTASMISPTLPPSPTGGAKPVKPATAGSGATKSRL